MVIDADGLNAFEGAAEEIRPDSEVDPFSMRVLTPHPGEMSRLTGLQTGEIQRNRIATAKKLAADTQTCVVLKGHRSVIASPEGQTWINTTGNPGMAKGGSGDVLSGIAAGILAQIRYMHMNTVLSELEKDEDTATLRHSLFLAGFPPMIRRRTKSKLCGRTTVRRRILRSSAKSVH